MKRRLVAYVLSLIMVLQSVTLSYWGAVAIGGILSLSEYSFADYTPSTPPTTTPAPDDSDGDGQFGPFDYIQEANNIGIGSIGNGIPSASSSGTQLWYRDHNGATQTWEMNDTSSPETSMIPDGYNDATSYSVSNLRDGFGTSGQSNLTSMVNSQKIQVDSEDPTANPSIMGMMLRDMDAQAENDVYHDMRNDPIVTQAASVDRGVAETFSNIFTDCESYSVPGAVDPSNPLKADCLRTSVSLPSTCNLSNNVTLIPIGGSTAVGMIIDDSGSMGGGPGSFMESAINAALTIAVAMDEAVDTELYSRSFKTNPIQDWPDTAASAANNYNNLVASGGTPLAGTMANLSTIINARPETNKIIIAISDGVPTDAGAVNPTIAANSDITWFGLGIQQNDMLNYNWDAVQVVTGANIDVGVFTLLSNSFQLINVWEGEQCLNIAALHDAGIINVSASCTTPPNGSGCVFVDTVWICPSSPWAASLTPTPFPTQVGPLCGAIQVSGITFSNSNCWTDASGDYHCVGDPGLNTCDTYVNNPSWGIESSQCIPGAVDPNTGECLLYGETYLGGYGSAGAATATAISCPGPMDCADGSCITRPQELNENFGQASTALNSTFQAAMDHECDIANPDTCTIFRGDGYSCHRTGFTDYGIIEVDCCDQAMSVSLQDYLQMGKFIYEQEATQEMIYQMGSWAETQLGVPAPEAVFDYLKGSWTDFTTAVQNTDLYKTVMEPISSFVDSIAAKTSSTGITSIQTGVTNTLAAVQSAVMNYIGEVLRSFGPIGEALVGTAAGSAGSSSSGLIGETQVDAAGEVTTTFNPVANVFQTVMAAYMVYQLVVLALNLLDGCEAEEFEFNTRRELGSCIVVPGYDCVAEGPDPFVCPVWPCPTTCYRDKMRGCCFASPLAKIINEQAALQGVGSPGFTSEGEECGGLSVTELGSLDWSLMDLDEWTEMLATTDQIPEHATKDPLLPTSPVDGATHASIGNISADNGHAYADAVQRVEAVTNFDIDDVRETTNRVYLQGADGSSYTAPPAP